MSDLIIFNHKCIIIHFFLGFLSLFICVSLCLDQEYYRDDQDGEDAGAKRISYS